MSARPHDFAACDRLGCVECREHDRARRNAAEADRQQLAVLTLRLGIGPEEQTVYSARCAVQRDHDNDEMRERLASVLIEYAACIRAGEW